MFLPHLNFEFFFDILSILILYSLIPPSEIPLPPLLLLCRASQSVWITQDAVQQVLKVFTPSIYATTSVFLKYA